ncbi:Dyp-type peroxidase family [Mucilaginibacter gossypiicola]|uniref:Dyp-type peroxidase family n=1 Tax=Mucilaginibacter gossypiicola TaxID=551995 RepID=A0A1H8LTH5_9SPHI|nr:Dyp-type peroxidase [Mucilaginibacter gossypiicola]SEO08431.1 Dyp-type peroxidase family [Mucilaginibacter gossypiicola]
MATLNFPDIQGFVLSSYASKMPCANYFLLKVTDAQSAKPWLASLIPDVTTGKDRKTDFSLNIAFTSTGLKAFGIKEAELVTFSPAFQDGMVSATRQQLLGDTGNSDSKYWAWGHKDNSVDMLLLLFATDETMLKVKADRLIDQFSAGNGLALIKILPAGRQPDAKEHFGFLDGIGQPAIEGTDQKQRQQNRTGHATELKAGEFILGYENEMQKRDPLPRTAEMQEFGKNGTYLVFRQIEQHVHKFWNYIKTTASGLNAQGTITDEEKLASKMVGRWPSGAPLSEYPNGDPAPGGTNEENNFSFHSADQDGLKCPIGAHIRRSNPRDSLFDDPEMSALTVRRHRIIRRGRSYGDRTKDVYHNDGEERGLHFICINSNIERQFEFVQQTWVNNPNFATLNKESDPLIGLRNDGGMFSIQGCPARTRIHNLTEFTTIKGGAYFFMPGMAALNALAR